jgi:hypothetical protein
MYGSTALYRLSPSGVPRRSHTASFLEAASAVVSRRRIWNALLPGSCHWCRESPTPCSALAASFRSVVTETGHPTPLALACQTGPPYPSSIHS